MSSPVKRAVVIAFIVACLTPSLAHANTINLTVGAGGVAGDHILGEVFTRKDFDQSGGQGDVDAEAINGLLAVALGTRSGADPEYWRSITNFGSLDAATDVGAGLYGNQTSFVLTQIFQYMIVGYDGTNGGSQAYYIGDLNVGDTINIVSQAHPNGVPKNTGCGGLTQPDCGHLVGGDYYGVTHTTFLNPGPNTRKVPDGGLAIALLGMAMAGMGLFARRVKK